MWVDRARHYYRDAGYGTELIHAALSSGWNTLPDLDSRIRALADFMDDPAATSLAAANKRIGNILKKTKGPVSLEINEDRLDSSEETALFGEVVKLNSELEPLLDNEIIPPAWPCWAGLKEPVDPSSTR